MICDNKAEKEITDGTDSVLPAEIYQIFHAIDNFRDL